MILWNDRLIPRSEASVDIEDRGYQFGDGIYEVIRVYGGKAFYLTEHLNRLEKSAREIRLPLPWDSGLLAERINQLVDANRLVEGTIYLQVTRGRAPRNHAFPEKTEPVLVAYTTEVPRPEAMLKEGIRTCTHRDIRWLRCDIKSLNLLGAVLAKQEAVEKGCKEAILVRDGTVTEGSSSNVFIVRNGTLYTHPADNLILHGITRAIVLKCAGEEGIPVKEETFSVDDLYAADEAFITGTMVEVCPVTRVDDRTIGDGVPGPVTRRLQQAFDGQIAHQCGQMNGIMGERR